MFNPFRSHTETPPGSPEVPYVSIAPPAVDSLLHPNTVKSFFPEKIQKDADLEKQAEIRRTLHSSLTALYTAIKRPDMEVQQAVESHLISPETLAQTYNELSDFLASDSSHSRIVLYVPFEMIPSTNWHPETQELSDAANRFSGVYMKKWNELLSAHDVRAHFADGDVLEAGMRPGPLPEVSKAAHLIPFLVQKNQITIPEVIKLMTESKDEVLRNSIADTIPVLADMGLLSEADLALTIESSDPLLRNMAIITKDNIANQKTEAATIYDSSWLAGMNERIENDLSKQKYDSSLSEKRAAWEKERDENKTIAHYGKEISSGLENQSLSFEEVSAYVETNANNIEGIAGMQGLRNAIEHTETAAQNAAVLQPMLKNLWQNSTPKMRDTIESTLLRWSSLQIIDEAVLKEFNIQKLNSESEEMKELSKQAQSIESDPELSKFIYPTCIVYGSKVKGYGTTSADTDLAVFVKPGTSMDDRPHIQELLAKKFNDQKAVEFWLTQKDNELAIQDFKNPDNTLGDSTLVSVLFQGVWCGKTESIRELYGKVLPDYMYEKNLHDVRQKEMERDTLQYRLMHKGYERLYPPHGGIDTKHSDNIDSDSMFWDSGYRRMATELFVTKVFLPKLEK